MASIMFDFCCSISALQPNTKSYNVCVCGGGGCSNARTRSGDCLGEVCHVSDATMRLIAHH